MNTVTAIAHPNIALIKYWGNLDDTLRIPSNGSISMNLAALETRTTVQIDDSLSADQVMLNSQPANARDYARITTFLDIIRAKAKAHSYLRMESANNFPTGSGIASSASGFAALALAGATVYGLALDEPALSRLARRGSGSACRSIPAGFVEWRPGHADEDSYAFSLAVPGHWDLVDLVALVDEGQKKTGSTEGHPTARSSPLQSARVEDAERRLALCRHAIARRDFEALTRVAEQDCLMMHAVMLTSTTVLIYWQPATLQVMQVVIQMRGEGLPAFFTIDAGANVHVLTPHQHTAEVEDKLRSIPGISDVLVSTAGGPARLVSAH
jgi:diphosphomevalonate decarboxylase